MLHHNFYGSNMQHGFNPLSVPNCTFWFKADALSGSEGSNVTSLPDSSGNGRNMSQADSAKQGLLRLANQNGLNGVDFDGSNDFYATSGTNAELDDVITATSPQEGCIFIVAKVRTITGSTSETHYACREIFTDGDGGEVTGGDIGVTLRTASGIPKVANGLHPVNVSGCQTDITLNAAQLITWRYQNNQHRFIQINANAEVDGGFGGFVDRASNPQILLGGNYNASLCADMILYEVLIYKTQLTSQQRLDIQNYLTLKWAVV